ncbi:MAG: hypothetical protein ACLR3X_07340 [Intestinibacter bartlettii]
MEYELMVILPENQLADKEYFPIKKELNYPFMLLEGSKNITEIFESIILPDIHFTTLDDYVIMSMVENGFGNKYITKTNFNESYKITAKRLEVTIEI